MIDKIGLWEALNVGEMVGYRAEPDTWSKRDYIIGLACYLISLPYHTLASADVIHRFKMRAQWYVCRGER